MVDGCDLLAIEDNVFFKDVKNTKPLDISNYILSYSNLCNNLHYFTAYLILIHSGIFLKFFKFLATSLPIILTNSPLSGKPNKCEYLQF